jgi:enamine deaminase RidA (YjgF/YER057c/UK114 family)
VLQGNRNQILQPEGWPRPKGYSNGVQARGEMVFVAGLIGWDEHGVFSDGFVGQFRQALLNTIAVLDEAGARPEHVVRMTWFITDRDAYLGSAREVGAVYRELMGKHYPAMAVVQVVQLMEAEALVVIETTAVIPDHG